MAAIPHAPVPQDVTDLQSLMGLVHFYRRFLANLSSLLRPLHSLVCDGKKWKWRQGQPDTPVLARFHTAKLVSTSTSGSYHFQRTLLRLLTTSIGSSGEAAQNFLALLRS